MQRISSPVDPATAHAAVQSAVRHVIQDLQHAIMKLEEVEALTVAAARGVLSDEVQAALADLQQEIRAELAPAPEPPPRPRLHLIVVPS